MIMTSAVEARIHAVAPESIAIYFTIITFCIVLPYLKLSPTGPGESIILITITAGGKIRCIAELSVLLPVAVWFGFIVLHSCWKEVAFQHI
jgi:hypothetical protein